MQTEKNNWTYLPSPIPEKSWGDVYENARVKQYNARVRNEFEQALGYNIVTAKSIDENTSNRYAIVTTEAFDLSAKLGAYDMRLTSTTPNLGEVKRAVIELKRLQSEGLPRVGVKDIFGSINEDMAKENLVRSPQLIARVRRGTGEDECHLGKSRRTRRHSPSTRTRSNGMTASSKRYIPTPSSKKVPSTSMTVTRKKTHGSRSQT